MKGGNKKEDGKFMIIPFYIEGYHKRNIRPQEQNHGLKCIWLHVRQTCVKILSIIILCDRVLQIMVSCDFYTHLLQT